MANEDIVHYLKEGKQRGFHLDVLQQNLVEKGFSQDDVDEALSVLLQNRQSQEESSPKEQQPQQQNHELKSEQPRQTLPGTRWMRTGGIFGIAFIILTISLALLNFARLSPIFVPTFLVLLLSIISTGFFYAGFIRMGRMAESHSLQFSAYSMIILLVALPVIGGLLAILSFVVLQQPIIPTTNIESTLPANLGVLGIIIALLIFALILFALIVQILFATGLIQAGRRVRYAKAAGILHLLLIIFSILSVIASIVMDPLLFATILEEGVRGKITGITLAFLILQALLLLLAFLVILLSSLSLFDASKKFESAKESLGEIELAKTHQMSNQDAENFSESLGTKKRTSIKGKEEEHENADEQEEKQENTITQERTTT